MDDHVLGIAEARTSLSTLVDSLADSRSTVAIIGSHRRPEAALIPYATYVKLRDSPAAPVVNLAFLRERAALIRRIGQAWGMHDIAVFGSVARGQERADSDVDLLVDANQDRSLFDIAGFESDLEQLLGRPVDVITRNGLDLSRARDRTMLDESILL